MFLLYFALHICNTDTAVKVTEKTRQYYPPDYSISGQIIGIYKDMQYSSYLSNKRYVEEVYDGDEHVCCLLKLSTQQLSWQALCSGDCGGFSLRGHLRCLLHLLPKYCLHDASVKLRSGGTEAPL